MGSDPGPFGVLLHRFTHLFIYAWVFCQYIFLPHLKNILCNIIPYFLRIRAKICLYQCVQLHTAASDLNSEVGAKSFKGWITINALQLRCPKVSPHYLIVYHVHYTIIEVDPFIGRLTNTYNQN